MATETTKPNIKHPHQRVGVFIDVQNMYYSAKALYNRKVNFGEILKTAVADRQLIRALAYVVRATGEEGAFFEALNQRGIETKERELQEFHSGVKKADWDVGITVDAIRIGEILDVVVLVSGDGDFVELVEYLKHHGKQVEVVAFRKSTSSRLVAAADAFVDLDSDPKYLIGSAGHSINHSISDRTETKDRLESSGDSFWIKPPQKNTPRPPTRTSTTKNTRKPIKRTKK
ncbi:NYN domain-containing protein [Patescibacteria group bacterium]|nr:NYN domain-containing protein [Patescibacteria group bacterium]MBU1029125.1 NYN domain-containing protein [Patescibacteria group bacterium]MBU1916474.1 NYN domain-containing protein [Patescibacteria group bacterium]